ncbi:MAG: class I SAM-dependent methyltransferase [Acidobacteria bacterium]|nr:class I SAM-dependent methyltransferase [Acidobacteriota bacterium]
MKTVLPDSMFQLLRERLPRRPSRARRESNKWLRHHCKDIQGKVLSIGSGNDADKQGDFYKNYFPAASSYTTSEVSREFKCDLTLDVQSMPEIEDESYDCVYCSGVLEHVEDYRAGLDELTRILKVGGILLLGLPFRQAIHMSPQDFWRFTEYGIRHLLRGSYEVITMVPIDRKRGREFPSAYWVKARKVLKSGEI